MGAISSKICPRRCMCCGEKKSESYDLRELPRPPRITNQNDSIGALKDGVLVVQNVDFCIENNGEAHHTNKFHLMTRLVDRCLVVRRGQPFTLDLLLNRPYDRKKDALSFIFHVGDDEHRGPSNETSAAVPVLDKGLENRATWSAVYEGQYDSHLLVSVTPSASCVVAAWTIDIDTKIHLGGSLSYTHPLPIYILFNPWCLQDSVYMPGIAHRDEYVLEDGGLMFKGVYNKIKFTPWHYDIYEKDILECSLFLVRRIGKLKGRERSDPIATSRVLSAVVNVQDDNGVIMGNWAASPSNYSGGKHPTKWIGSMDILQAYYNTRKPVKYGQCWVFAGVLTTVCRALGIPCRPVTGYNAAHDSQGSLTIDVIMDDDGNEVKNFTRDSIWNYHVWNEVWMDRPDLGPDYGGWQAIDSTPQEASEKIFRCGPASLKAVRDAELQRPYDASFVFAQVNADKVLWKYSGEIQPLKLLRRDTTSIGKKISTKTIGKMDREDITDIYKYPEQSGAERSTMEKALRKSENIFARYYLNDAFNDVTFDFELQDDILIGREFDVILHVNNRSAINAHHIRGVLRIVTVTHTGVIGNVVKKYDFDVKMDIESNEAIKMHCTFDEYFHRLVDQSAFNIACFARIVDTDFEYFAQDDFRLNSPNITISTEGELISKQPFKVKIELKNPLPIPIKSGKFYLQGPGLDKRLKIDVKNNIQPGEEAVTEIELTPPWAGRHQITAKFTSKELHDVDGFLSIMVHPPPEYNSVVNGINGTVE